ncbi:MULTISPECIES: hypothetical protein [Streptomyces]|uniref:hypothetical protein n=1 Tax=Streptomyces TaxID=1883 RepID=UPI001F3B0391|nr:hypothetical protein [Streptomyces sp. CBMAI 2042]
MARRHDFSVWYRAKHFPPKVVRHETDRMTFPIDDLAHALFVTGRAPADRAAHGATSLYEWLHRVALVPAYLRMAPGGRLMRSDLARELDRSEKVALSYTLGQAMTGIFSERILSVRFLMHVDRYAGRHGLAFDPSSKKRADLFGQKCDGGWVVAEAKGRSGTADWKLEQAMISQKGTIKSIDGVAPDFTFGCAAHFPKLDDGSEPLAILAIDPPDFEPDAIDLRISLDKFVQAYYEPFLVALEEGGRKMVGGDFVVAHYDAFNMRIGVLRSVLERVERANSGFVSGLHHDVTTLLNELVPEERPAGQFLDGTMVKTDWAASMNQDDWSELYYIEKF